jgi:hypothetical protein
MTDTAKPKGTNAQVREWWRDEYPKAIDRTLRARDRHGMAQEFYPYLPASPTRTGAASSAGAQRHRPTVGVGAGVGPARSLHGELGTFFSEREAARGCVSPLGNRVW